MSNTKSVGFSIYSFPHRVMPVDLAMHAQISLPVSQLLGISALRASSPNLYSPLLRRATSSSTSSLFSSSSARSLSSYSPGTYTLRKKKRVVFADAKGLSLTSVRIFTTDPSEMETEDAPQPEEHVKPRAPMQSVRLRLKLGFPQPVADRASLIQLESCCLSEKALSGTVRPGPKFVTFNDKFTPMDNNKGKNYHILVENVVPEPRLVKTSRRNFITPSPQRYSAWPEVRGHELHRMRHLTCKDQPYTNHLLNRTWG